jgi:hypothetical protein
MMHGHGLVWRTRSRFLMFAADFRRSSSLLRSVHVFERTERV